MDIREAYEVMQSGWVDLFNVKVGTKVKVLRTNGGLELGSETALHTQNELDRTGLRGVVDSIESHRVWINMPNDTCFSMPFHVLEVLKPRVKAMTIKEISEMAGCEVKIVK